MKVDINEDSWEAGAGKRKYRTLNTSTSQWKKWCKELLAAFIMAYIHPTDKEEREE